MRVDLRPLTAVLLLCLVLAVGSVGSMAVAELSGPSEPDHEPTLVSVEEGQTAGEGTAMWPYTSRDTDFRERTLAINVLVHGDQAAVQRHLRRAGSDWEQTDAESEDGSVTDEYEGPAGTTTAWRTAGGATRYTYVRTPKGGIWLVESYQLHEGDYLGSRHHIRAYEAPGGEGNWTAMQAHREHWDWFHLRHTVDGISESQVYVEREFMDRWFVEDVWRRYVGTDGGTDDDGWLTVVRFEPSAGGGATGVAEEDSTLERPSLRSLREAFGESGSVSGGLSPTDPLVGLAASVSVVGLALSVSLMRLPTDPAATGRLVRYRDRLDAAVPQHVQHALLLGGSVVGLYLSVRFGGVVAERLLPLPPKAIAVLLYPVVFAGVPIVVYLLARPLGRPTAFAAASLGFLVAVLLDYTYLGVRVVPLAVLIHRSGLAVALGLLAVGASRPERHATVEAGHVRTGVLLWLVSLGLPLLQFV